jgi:hypothetical protein
MPTLPDVSKVVRVSLIASDAADLNVVTRFYISYTGTAPTSANLDSFGSTVANELDSHVKGLTKSGINYREIDLVDLSSPSAGAAAHAIDIDGTRSGTTLAAGTCCVVSYKIARRYRGGHPRGYWPVGTISDIETSQDWTDAFLSSVDSGLGSFFTGVTANPWSGGGTLKHVNVSYFHGFTSVEDPITHRWRNIPTARGVPVVDEITQLIARKRFGSQRRRNRTS